MPDNTNTIWNSAINQAIANLREENHTVPPPAIDQATDARNRDLAFAAGYLESLAAIMTAIGRRHRLIEDSMREADRMDNPENRIAIHVRLIGAFYSDFSHLSEHTPTVRRLVEMLRTGNALESRDSLFDQEISLTSTQLRPQGQQGPQGPQGPSAGVRLGAEGVVPRTTPADGLAIMDHFAAAEAALATPGTPVPEEEET